ncbi:glucokinase [Roseimicrobium gellanilyticum]|uniref:Glucokinase n=1 Tax=Roseimicrobium gellanilyticum TaxID=748857 RepID=A0A366HNF0_9BACT|nr:ROK family protein [Roseimicrobium gellanilyticum]RBP44316.1 glucokinase [Roseimicrobium gellanilyticum]
MAKKSPAKKIALSGKPFWVGFDFGGTKMMAVILDADYNVLGTARKSTQGGGKGAARGIKRIQATIEEAMANANVRPAKMQGIGIGCPGTVNTEKGILIHAPNLNWKRVMLGPELEKLYKCPVAVLNDVDAGTYGEYTLGAGKGSRSLLGVFPGTGLGAGFVYDGNLIRGANVSCMELGMIYVPGTHLSSAFPGYVLFEDLTSRLGIAAAASVECTRGNAPLLDAKTNAVLKEMRSKALSTSFNAHERATETIFLNSLQYLGMGISMVANLMAPDHITLGGGLVEEMPKLYLQAMREQVERFTVPEIYRGMKFSIAKLGNTAVACGSIAWLRAKK